MAIGDLAIEVGDLDAAMDETYRLRPAKAQFTRCGETSKWFDPKGQVLQGKRFHYKAFIQPATAIRRQIQATAATSEFPVPHEYKYLDLSVAHTDLKFFQATVRYNLLEEMRGKSKEHCIADLAMKAVGEVDDDFGNQLNASFHQPATCAAAKVKQIYDADGSAFSLTGAHTPAFISISHGNVNQFQPGEVLDIHDTDTATKNAIVKVWDVIYGTDGPPSSGVRVADIGPGLIVEPCDANGAVYACNWNAGTMSGGGTSYTPATGDFIARSGEYHASTFRNIAGFPSLFDPTVDIWYDEDHATIDRESAGYAWMNPLVVAGGTDGSEVTFDIDTHFRELEDYMPFMVKAGRQARVRADQGINLKKSLLAICPVSIVNDQVAEAKTTMRFTATAATSMDAATRRELFGEVGFDGLVYHSASLGPIAFQADPACRPYHIELIDPNSCFYVSMTGNTREVTWLSGSNGRWTPLEGDTNRTPTFYVQGGAWVAMQLVWDQPRTCTEIQWVKSSV